MHIEDSIGLKDMIKTPAVMGRIFVGVLILITPVFDLLAASQTLHFTLMALFFLPFFVLVFLNEVPKMIRKISLSDGTLKIETLFSSRTFSLNDIKYAYITKSVFLLNSFELETLSLVTKQNKKFIIVGNFKNFDLIKSALLKTRQNSKNKFEVPIEIIGRAFIKKQYFFFALILPVMAVALVFLDADIPWWVPVSATFFLWTVLYLSVYFGDSREKAAVPHLVEFEEDRITIKYLDKQCISKYEEIHSYGISEHSDEHSPPGVWIMLKDQGATEYVIWYTAFPDPDQFLATLTEYFTRKGVPLDTR